MVKSFVIQNLRLSRTNNRYTIGISCKSQHTAPPHQRTHCPSCLSLRYCVRVCLCVRTERTCRPGQYGKESCLLPVLLSLPYWPGRQVFSVLSSTTTHNWHLPYRPGRQWIDSQQCCQVVEIPAKKLKRGHRKKKFVAEFWLILPKTGRKGAAENFQKKSLIFSCDNHE